MRRGALVALALLPLAGGCAKHVPYALSTQDQQRFGGHVLRIALPHRNPAFFGLDDCTLYRAETAHEEIVGWTKVLASDWGQDTPKFMTVCTSQHVKYDGKYLIADFCAQAIGAGGGCAGSGTYRSRTGDVQGWQILTGRGWETLPKN
ncbi:MAG TPA: hypothetical protein VGX91_08835 [Candidatus Cybelea sp.]|nr:hypothetical protein [Candidatus Cybelea sp.]